MIFFFLQNTLNALERDCDDIGSKVDQAIAEDNSARSHNMWAWSKGLSLLFGGLLLPMTLVIHFFASSVSDKLIKDLLGSSGYNYLVLYLVSITYISRTNVFAANMALSGKAAPWRPLLNKGPYKRLLYRVSENVLLQ